MREDRKKERILTIQFVISLVINYYNYVLSVFQTIKLQTYSCATKSTFQYVICISDTKITHGLQKKRQQRLLYVDTIQVATQNKNVYHQDDTFLSSQGQISSSCSSTFTWPHYPQFCRK